MSELGTQEPTGETFPPDGQNESIETTGIEMKLGNVNVRNEKHGDDRVKACDLSLSMQACPQWIIEKMAGSPNKFWHNKEGKPLTMNVGQVECSKALADQEVTLRNVLDEEIVTFDVAVVDKLKFTPQNGGTAVAELKVRSVLTLGQIEPLTDAMGSTVWVDIQDLQEPLL